MKPKKSLPSPEMLLVEARGAIGRDAPLDVDAYASVIAELRNQKNYSFGQISDWLGERVGRSINKGIIYRVYSSWMEQLEQEQEEPPFDEPEPLSPEEEYARAVHELKEEIMNFALEKAKELGSGGCIIDDALERAYTEAKLAREDEKAANEADAASGKE